jgi:hypothetical protein
MGNQSYLGRGKAASLMPTTTRILTAAPTRRAKYKLLDPIRFHPRTMRKVSGLGSVWIVAGQFPPTEPLASNEAESVF